MSFSSPQSPYEAPIRSDTFYKSTQPPLTAPFLLKPSNTIVVPGDLRSFPRDWYAYFTVGILLFVAIVLWFWQGNSLLLWTSLNQRGQTTQATISNDRINTGKSTSYYVTFTYNVSGLDYSVEQSVQSGAYYSLPIGTALPIRYLPDSPGQAQLAGPFIDDPTNLISVLFTVLAVGLGMGTVLISIRYMRRMRNLILHGKFVDGVVESATVSRSKNGTTLQMKYSFTSPATGQSIIRSESGIRGDLRPGEGPGKGTPVRVLFLNDKNYRVM